MDLLESYPAPPQGVTSPTPDVVDQIYIHLTQAGYSVMSDRLEAKLDDLIISQ
jgi:lysophospholipase L1-like esterase